MGVTGPSELVPSALGSDVQEIPRDGTSEEEKTSPSSKLMFAPWHSAVDEGFWHRLASFKLETQRLDEHPVPLSGFFAPCSHPQIPSHLQLLEESLPPDPGGSSSTSYAAQGNRNKCPVPGTLYNSNTLEVFTGLDTPSLLKGVVQQIWEDIQSGKAEETSNLLSRFLLISFADLKKWSFYYWFAFPAIVMTPPATTSSCKQVSEVFGEEECADIRRACSEWRSTPTTASSSFFLLHFTTDGVVIARPIKDWKVANEGGGKVIAAFCDPCNIPTNPGWPLRNLLALAVARWEVTEMRVLCYREKRGFIDLQLSLVVDIVLPELPEWKVPGFIPKGVGWEVNVRGKARPRSVHLAATMDPERAANDAADLNLKLMRWRLLPSLDLPLLSRTKCLLLGAGTLGCQVARGLLAWGIRHITFVDYGKVAMSNPCRQSLYNVEDCLKGGRLKVDAAADSLKRIIPGVEVSGVYMSIPMPGHSVSPTEVDNVIADCSRLKALVEEHDVVFLLTDTRESRWLPTLLCAEANKVAINAALGFDTFLVMRHGAGPASVQGENLGTTRAETSVPIKSPYRLGCYFCNDVVAPLDSTANRTLDQQCTVTRPGLAPIAAAVAVELTVNLLHHPQRINAPRDKGLKITESTPEPLGISPHQVRGCMGHFSQNVVDGVAFDKCTACSSIVVEEFRKRGMEFILEVLNQPNYLEDLTGLTEMMASTLDMTFHWDNDGELTDEEDVGKESLE